MEIVPVLFRSVVNKILLTATLLCMVLGVAILTCFAGEAKTRDVAAQVMNESSTPEFRLGMDFYQKQQFGKALDSFKKAADRGDVEAFLQLGLMYDFGRGICQNYTEAMRWYLKAAEKGEPRAMYLVGHMHEYGEGVPVDTNEAFDWYQKSARRGHASAQFEVGKVLTRSETDTQRFQEGIKWLQLAVGQCHTKAAELLQGVSRQPVDTSFCAGG